MGYIWSYLVCRMLHLVPIWQPLIGSSFHLWDALRIIPPCHGVPCRDARWTEPCFDANHDVCVAPFFLEANEHAHEVYDKFQDWYGQFWWFTSQPVVLSACFSIVGQVFSK
jgi:hypothetical protein